MQSQLRPLFRREPIWPYKAIACAVMILAPSVIAQPVESPLQRRMKVIKEYYRFDEWAGSVKLPKKLVRQLNLKEDDFAPEIKVVFRDAPSAASCEAMAFVAHVASEGSHGFSLDIKVLKNAREAQECIFRIFLMSSAPLSIQGSIVQPGEQFDLGDHCIFSAQGPRVIFTRNNLQVIIRGNAGARVDDLYTIAKKVDSLAMGRLEDDNGQPVPDVPQPQVKGSAFKGAKAAVPDDERHAKRRALEEAERQMKALPEAEARRHCLEEAEKLLENLDAEPERLEFYMRGLGRPFDPPAAKVLRQILMLTKNEMLRAAAIRQLSKWVADDAHSRQTVMKDLVDRLHDPNRQVRQDVLRALGQSGDLRQLKRIAPLLDDADAQVRIAAAEAVSDLLGWQRPKTASGDIPPEWVGQVKAKSAAVLHALEEAERVIAAQKPE